MSKKIEAGDHWRHELTKLRCWLSGYIEGRSAPGQTYYMIPGEQVLHQIIKAIDDADRKQK